MRRIILACVLSLALCSPAMAGPNEGVCPSLTSGKIDTVGDPATVTVTAPDGLGISLVCVKAGSTETGDGPELLAVDPPSTSLTFGHSSGKDVSHWSASYVELTTEPPAPPDEGQAPEPPTPPDEGRAPEPPADAGPVQTMSPTLVTSTASLSEVSPTSTPSPSQTEQLSTLTPSLLTSPLVAPSPTAPTPTTPAAAAPIGPAPSAQPALQAPRFTG